MRAPNYTLDDKGKGKVTFVQQNGTTCEAPAEARWDSGKLVIEEKANPKCADGRTYARNTVNCEVGKDGVANARAASRATSAATTCRSAVDSPRFGRQFPNSMT